MMSIKIVLQRPLRVECWRVVGQVAKAATRAELMPVLLRARETDGTDAGDLANHLLFEPRSRKSVAERMLRIAEVLKLVERRDRQFVLTAEGAEALANQEVFVPEDGVWTIWGSADPLLPGAILRVDPCKDEPNALDEVRGSKKAAAKDRSFATTPKWLRQSLGRPMAPCAAGRPLIRIDHLEERGERLADKAALRVAWDVTAGALALEGNLAGGKVDAALVAPDRSPAWVWQHLLEQEALWPRWDSGRQALRLKFHETEDTERAPMLRDVRFLQPVLPELGSFDPLVVGRVPLLADTAADAQAWAEWRLANNVQTYATSALFTEWCAQARRPFEEEFNPTLATRAAMAHAAWRDRGERPAPSVWHLIAAEDWGM